MDPAPRAGTQLFGTSFAQRVIWAHQHPADCAAARYLLYTPQARGLGPRALLALPCALRASQARREGFRESKIRIKGKGI